MKRSVESLRDMLFRLHAEARDMGEHHVAYHALAGALHAAESLEDQVACLRIEQLARQHGEWLDVNAPQHTLSASSAATRGHETIFRQLTVMAHSARLRMQFHAEQKQGRPKAPARKAKKRKR